MVRIEKTERNGQALWVVVGRLTGMDGDYFAQELETFFRERPGQLLYLDLCMVDMLSNSAIAAVKARQEIVRMTGCNGFLRQLLQAEGLSALFKSNDEHE